MALVVSKHRALPVGPHEDPTQNEQRYRAEVERATLAIDLALEQIDQRMNALEARIAALEAPVVP